jgi:crotonobetainyl-CoA:carnitine CoA-transferase CaiB-like acyl-CoA transferase
MVVPGISSTQTRTSGPLAGIRVIDLSTGIAGPLATMLMADNGASVVRVASPHGDPSLDTGGYPVWNRGKKGLVLDLEQAGGVAVLERLLANADVLVESLGPAGMQRLGLGYAALASKHPRLVYTSITGHGAVGEDRDRPALEALVQARMGLMHSAYWKPREGPVYGGFAFGGYGAASFALIGTLLALYARATTGRGQLVDTSIADGTLAMMALHWNRFEKGPRGSGYSMKNRGPGIVDIFRCADGGFIHLHTGADGAFERMMEGMGMREDYPAKNNIPDPDWQRMLERTRAWFLAHTRDEGIAMLNKADCPALPVLQPGEAMHDAQSKAMRFSEIVEDPLLGPLEQVGIALRFARTPGAIQGPAPRGGEHSDAILREAGYSPAEIGALRAARAVA